MKIKIPLYYFPTKIMMVDDDSMFSNSMALKLHEHRLDIFASPQMALGTLNEGITHSASLFNLNESLDAHALSLNHELFNKLVYSDKNKGAVSTVLVDFHMPEMTGIEFLHAIENISVQKILLTGEQDYTIAINAFNNGLINKYIRKNDKHFIEEIQAAILKAEWQYFLNLSESLINGSEINYDFLDNAALADVFQTVLQEQHIIAFALCDQQGDFLLLDNEGKQKYFSVRTFTQLKQLATIAEEDDGTKKTVDQLNNLEVIPFFGANKNTWDFPANTWDKYLFTATKLDDKGTLLWALIDPTTMNLNTQPVSIHRIFLFLG